MRRESRGFVQESREFVCAMLELTVVRRTRWGTEGPGVAERRDSLSLVRMLKNLGFAEADPP